MLAPHNPIRSLCAALALSTALVASGASVQTTNETASTPPTNTSVDHTPATQVGPFIFQSGQEAKKQEAGDILVSIVKVLAWPALIALLGLIFKAEIRAFFGKIKSVKAKDYGLEMAPDERLVDQQKAAPPEAPPISTPKNAGDFEKEKAKLVITPALQPIIEQVAKSVRESPFTPEQNVELGILAVSKLVLVADFWRIYNLIFGSQLTLLQTLNTRPLPDPELETFFANLKHKFPEVYGGSNPEAYVSFLVNSKLLVHQDGKYTIAPKGKEFLVWCIENHLGFDKPL